MTNINKDYIDSLLDRLNSKSKNYSDNQWYHRDSAMFYHFSRTDLLPNNPLHDILTNEINHLESYNIKKEELPMFAAVLFYGTLEESGIDHLFFYEDKNESLNSNFEYFTNPQIEIRHQKDVHLLNISQDWIDYFNENKENILNTVNQLIEYYHAFPFDTPSQTDLIKLEEVAKNEDIQKVVQMLQSNDKNEIEEFVKNNPELLNRDTSIHENQYILENGLNLHGYFFNHVFLHTKKVHNDNDYATIFDKEKDDFIYDDLYDLKDMFEFKIKKLEEKLELSNKHTHTNKP